MQRVIVTDDYDRGVELLRVIGKAWAEDLRKPVPGDVTAIVMDPDALSLATAGDGDEVHYWARPALSSALAEACHMAGHRGAENHIWNPDYDGSMEAVAGHG